MLKILFSLPILISSLIGLNVASLAMPTEAEAARSSRQSSSLSRKIRALDSDPVTNIPIPILFGVTPAQISDTWGEARAVGRTHEGTDIFAQRGAFIVSPTEAVVISMETDSSRNSLGGTYVWTANPGGERYYYAHLDAIARNIEVGTVLEKGDLIGYVGNTGNAAGGATHLHFGIYERGPTNPYPRLTEQFSTEERLDALEKILDETDNAEVLAATVVSQYRSFFVRAKVEGYTLPEAIEKVMTSNNPVLASSARNLTLGASGPDVKWIQELLITQNKGAAASALAAAGSTGYFGPLTQRALAEYQTMVGIIPASGYFGPVTRASLQLAGLFTFQN